MSKKIIYAFSSECPYLHDFHTIHIDYHEIDIVGTNKVGYKKGNYSCNINDCPYPNKDEYGRCPVYLESPSEPI